MLTVDGPAERLLKTNRYLSEVTSLTLHQQHNLYSCFLIHAPIIRLLKVLHP